MKKDLQRGAEHRQYHNGEWSEETTSEDQTEAADDVNDSDDDSDDHQGPQGRNAHIDQD